MWRFSSIDFLVISFSSYLVFFLKGNIYTRRTQVPECREKLRGRVSQSCNTRRLFSLFPPPHFVYGLFLRFPDKAEASLMSFRFISLSFAVTKNRNRVDFKWEKKIKSKTTWYFRIGNVSSTVIDSSIQVIRPMLSLP